MFGKLFINGDGLIRSKPISPKRKVTNSEFNRGIAHALDSIKKTDDDLSRCGNRVHKLEKTVFALQEENKILKKKLAH